MPENYWVEFPIFPGSDTETVRKVMIFIRDEKQYKKPGSSSDVDNFQIPNWSSENSEITEMETLLLA